MPLKVQRLMQQKRYYTSVVHLNNAVKKMFGEDLVAVAGLSLIREQIMDLKEVLLELCVTELRDCIVGVNNIDLLNKEYNSGSDSEVSDKMQFN